MFLSTPISDSIKNIYEIEQKDSTIFEQVYNHNSKRIESMRLIPALVRRLINSSYLSDLINYRLIAESQWSFIMRLHTYTEYNLLALGDQLFNWLQLVWRKIPDDLIDQLDRIVAHASILHVSKPFTRRPQYRRKRTRKEEQEKERREKNRIRNKVVRKYISPDRRLSIERVRVKFNTNFLSAKCKVNGARWIKGGTENKIEKNLLVVPIVYHGERERSREDTVGLTASDT